MKFDKKRLRWFGCRECLLSFAVKMYAKGLQAKFSDRAEQLPSSQHTCCKQYVCMCTTTLCTNGIIRKWHVQQEYVVNKNILEGSFQVMSLEVYSWRLFPGNEVDTHLSANSVCVSPLKLPICDFGGEQKGSSYFSAAPLCSLRGDWHLLSLLTFDFLFRLL